MPWSRVYLGEKYLGMTPLSDEELPAGNYVFTLVNPQLDLRKDVSLRIVAGKHTRSKVPLR